MKKSNITAVALYAALMSTTGFAFAEATTSTDCGTSPSCISMGDATSKENTVSQVNPTTASSLPAIAADHYVSINDGNVHRGNYNNDGATGGNSIAIGVSAGATGIGASAIGASASATGGSSIGVGTFAEATGNVSIAIGEQAKATENGATALGTKSNASGGGSTAIGSGSQASAQNATALGGGSNAAGNASIAVGVQSSASAGQSVAIGRHAVADTNDSVALGSYSKTATAVGTSSATVNGITYGGFAGAAPVGTVSVGDAGAERTITNVAAGRITPTSTDAVNGSQLYATQNVIGKAAASTANILGGNAKVASDGTLTMSNIGGTGKGNINDAIKVANDQANKPLTFAGDSGTPINRKLGEAVNVKGGNAGTLTEGNIGVVADGDNTLTVKLAEAINLGSNGSIAMGNTKVNNDGLTITGGPSVTSGGINAGGKAITNVASGGTTATNAANIGDVQKAAAASKTTVTQGSNIVVRKITDPTTGADSYEVATAKEVKFDKTTVGTVVTDGTSNKISGLAAGEVSKSSTDAINGSQLYQVASQANGNSTQINNINNRIDDMDKDLRAGIAGATAIAFLQRPNEAGKSMVSAAVGGYRGEQALALGYATNSDNNKWSTKVGLGVDTQKNINWGGSVGYQW